MSGYSGGGSPARFTISGSLTAGVVQSQADGLALAAGRRVLHQVTTVGTAGDTVVLPTPVAGDEHIVENSAAVNRCQVFPAVGGDLGNGVNAKTHIPAGSRAHFVALNSTVWVDIITGVIQTVQVSADTSGDETTTAQDYPETSLQISGELRYKASRWRCTGKARLWANQVSGTPAGRNWHYKISRDSTAGKGVAEDGGDVHLVENQGRDLIGASAADAHTKGSTSWNFADSTLTDTDAHTYTLCLASEASTITATYRNGSASTDADMMLEEVR